MDRYRGGVGGGPPPSRPSDDPLINLHRGGFSGNLHPFDISPPRYPLTTGGGGGFYPIDGDGDFRPLVVRGGRNFNPSEFEVLLSGPRFNPEFEVPLSLQKRRFDFPGRGEPSPDRFGGGNFDRRQSEGGAIAKLYVGSIPKTATEADIRPPFEEYGNVVEVALIKDKRSGQQQGNLVFASAGCCFIKYATSEEADRAIRALHNQYILPGGVGPIQVRYADGERELEYKLYVGSLNKHATEKEVEEIFLPYGRVEDVYLMRDELKQSRGCGFVKYSNKDVAHAAINALNGIYRMRGCQQPLIVRFADPKRPRPGETRGSPGFGPMNQQGMLPSDMGMHGKQSSAPMSTFDNNLNSINSLFAFKSILEKDKLNGSNFTDWYRNLRIVLKMAKRSHVLERAVPAEPQSQSDDHRKVWEKLKEESDEVGYLMLACMSPEIQKGMEETPAYQMITQLKDMFQPQARQERYEIMQKFIGCRMVEGTSVSTHVLKMKGYLDQLDKLGTPMAHELAGDIILNSLPPSFAPFVKIYIMNGWDKTIIELHQMLKTVENNMPNKSSPLTSKSSEVLAVRSGGVKKPNKKGKAKTKVQTPDASASTPKGKGVSRPKVPLSERKCHHCNKMGHWRRNCRDYLATKKPNLNEAGSSGTKEA